MTNRSRQAVLAVLATAILLTSSFAGGVVAGVPSTADAVQTDTPDGDEVIDSFVERISTLETAQFTQTVASTYNNETNTRTVRVVADLEDSQKRTETVSTSVGSNTTTILNESTTVTYNEDENTVSEYDVSGTTVLRQIEVLGNESRLNYEYLGTDTVEGQNTYVLDVVPEQQSQTDSDVESSVTLYVNTETHFPVRMVSETITEDTEFSSTITYENVTLDEPVPESAFELDVPANATNPTENSGPEITSYGSYSELASNTDLSVPDANVTDEFSFERGTIVDGEEYHSVSLAYNDGNQTVTVNTRAGSTNSFDYSDSERYRTVEVGDTTGYLYASNEFTSLHWETDQSYNLYGQTSNGTAVDVAQAIVDG